MKKVFFRAKRELCHKIWSNSIILRHQLMRVPLPERGLEAENIFYKSQLKAYRGWVSSRTWRSWPRWQVIFLVISFHGDTEMVSWVITALCYSGEDSHAIKKYFIMPKRWFCSPYGLCCNNFSMSATLSLWEPLWHLLRKSIMMCGCSQT